MIYTSYFPNINKLPDNIVPISISRKAPPGYTGIEFKKLAPSYELLSHWQEHHDEEYYTETFTQEVLKKLSRHLVSKWLRDSGFDCIEWQSSK